MKHSKLEQVLYNKSNLSISTKVFIFVVVIFSLFLSIFAIFQTSIFDKHYTNIKIEEEQKLLEDFNTQYQLTQTSEEIDSLILRHANENNSSIIVMDEFGNLLYMNSYKIMLLPENSETPITFTIDNAISNQNFTDLNLKIGEEISVYYYINDIENNNTPLIYIPNKIIKEDKSWSFGYFDNIKMSNMNYTKGKILSISLPGYANSKLNTQKFESFMTLLKNYNKPLEKQLNIRDVYTYINNNHDTNNSYGTLTKEIVKNGKTEFLISIFPLNEINNAVKVISDLYIIWLLITISTSIILSFILSKIVTGPIIHITNITKKIKNLDFSEKCDVVTKDEIGLLAKNINEMADKLNNNITEQQELNEDLMEANKQLLKDIEHKKLLEEQRKDFISAVSHELKTPLAIIRAYSEGLETGVSEEKQKKYSKIIVDETKKMDELIINMLEMSKLENGAQKTDIKENNLSLLVEQIIERFKTPCLNKNIELKYNIQKDIIRNFDIQLLEQAITNLFTNAIKYSNGSIIINLNNEGFSIENSGPHIPEESIQKLWDKFYKVDKARDRSLGGSGLGLSIVKNIFKIHNAEYKVENTDIGVKFSFNIKK